MQLSEPLPGGSLSALLQVDCYAGYKAGERPLRFSFIHSHSPSGLRTGRAASPRARVYEVTEILDRWYGPDYECFKVRADDHHLYVLRHRLGDDAWSLDAFRRDPRPARAK